MYNVGNLLINIENFPESQSLKRLASFQYLNNVGENSQPDVTYEFRYLESIELPKDEAIIYKKEDIIVAEDENVICFFHIYGGSAYALTEEFDFAQFRISLLAESKHYVLHPYLLPNLMHLDRVLLQKASFVLHASYIEVNESSILFTAPSGGGKTTQAELWKTYKAARIINGDKCIVGKKAEGWFTYGIPFSGSSPYCLNETYPLKAIVILGKGTENQLYHIGMRGFSEILSQTILNQWDKEYCNKLFDLVIEVCTQIPVYYYSCTKEPEAVEVLWNKLFEKGE